MFYKKIVAICLFLLLSFGDPENLAAQPLSAVELLEDDFVGAIEISPDGKLIAISLHQNGVPTIAILNADSGSVVTLYKIPVDKIQGKIKYDALYIRQLRWLNNSQIKLNWRGTSLTKSDERVYGTSAYISIEKNKIFRSYHEMMGSKITGTFNIRTIHHSLSDNPDILVVSGRRNNIYTRDLFHLNTVSGKIKRIARGESRTFKWLPNKQGRPIIRVDYSGRNPSYRASGNKLATIYAINPDTGKTIKRIKTITLRDENTRQDLMPVLPGPEDHQYYVNTDTNEEFLQLKLFDWQQEKFVESPIAVAGHDINDILTYRETGDVLGLEFQDDIIQYKFLDDDLNLEYTNIRNQFSATESLYVDSYSADASKLLFFVTGVNDPGTYYLYKRETHELLKLIARHPKIDKVRLGIGEIIHYRARDGMKLTGFITHPVGRAPTSQAPLIVMVHGGPEVRDYFSYDPEVQYFASRGYRIFQPYYRGSEGKGRLFAESGYGEWGNLIQHDISDGTKELHKQGLASPLTTCIMGASFGGYSAMLASVTQPELYKCAVATSGISDLPELIRWEKRMFDDQSVRHDYVLKAIGDPKKDKQKLEDYSPITHATKLNMPLMLVHGEEDYITPVDQSKRMSRALTSAGKKHIYVTYPRTRHGGWSKSVKTDYWNRLEAFFEANIGG